MPAPAPSPLRLHPDLSELPALLDYIEEFAEAHELPAADAHAMALVAEELFANTVNHGECETDSASVHFGLSLHDKSLQADYSDAAAPFDPTTAAVAPIPHSSTPAEERAIGGLGIHLIRKLMHDVKYARQDGRNVLTLTRHLGVGRLAIGGGDEGPGTGD